jgi:ABC-type multidrug transport system fused ATPase/permease subunit
MATEKQAAPAAAGAGEGMLAHLSKMAWQALPAIASAISFVGFVALVGAAIVWVRFDAAHLPATQAMLALPRQELVAIGALALGTFVIGAVVAVLLVYLLDSKGDATEYTARGLVAVAVAEMLPTFFFIGHHSVGTYLLLAAWLVVIGIIAAFVVSSAMRNFFSRSRLKRASEAAIKAHKVLDAAEDAYDGARCATEEVEDNDLKKVQGEAKAALCAANQAYARSIEEWNKRADQVKEHRAQARIDEMNKAKGQVSNAANAIALILALKRAEDAAGHVFGAIRDHMFKWLRGLGKKVDISDPSSAALWTISIVLALLASCVIVAGVLCLAKQPKLSWLAILLGVAALLAMMNLFSARATESFVWYGVSVFFSVLIFGAGLEIARTLHEPEVQPVALVRKDRDIGTCGVFIAQTGDRVYVGRLPTLRKRPGEIFWVPTSDVDLVSVGQPEKIGSRNATRRFSDYAKSMLERLYEDRGEEAALALKNTKVSEEGKKPASKKQAERIHGLHVVTNTEEREAPPKEVRSKSRPHVTIDGANCTATQRVGT